MLAGKVTTVIGRRDNENLDFVIALRADGKTTR
jgi:hypothetical protein